MPVKRKPIKERFEAKFKKTSGCWEWTAAKFISGYGMFQIKRSCYANRVSWELYKGPIPKGMLVCHKCDNPGCVNPDHLFLGTPSDNRKDMIAKNRGPNLKGIRHPSAKLTEKDVLAIRAADGTHKEIAKKYGVTRPLIGYIKSKKNWSHI